MKPAPVLLPLALLLAAPLAAAEPQDFPRATIVAYHDRWGDHSKSGGVYVSFSRDEGETWDEPFLISPGAYPTLYEYRPGEMICACYRSNSLLEAAFFPIKPRPVVAPT